jgi:hypothetical protein
MYEFHDMEDAWSPWSGDIRVHIREGRPMKRRIIVCAAACLWVQTSNASILFQPGPGNNNPVINSAGDQGVGQPISVTSAAVVTQFGFYLDMFFGGDIKFLIFDSTNTQLLYSSAPEAIGASNSLALVMSPVISFDADAGETYHFGFAADNIFGFGYYFPEEAYSQNGFSYAGGNDVYALYAMPTFERSGNTNVGLEIDGTLTPASVPEPAMLLPLALVFAVGLYRSRRRLMFRKR